MCVAMHHSIARGEMAVQYATAVQMLESGGQLDAYIRHESEGELAATAMSNHTQRQVPWSAPSPRHVKYQKIMGRTPAQPGHFSGGTGH